MREKLGADQVVVWRWHTPPGAFISFVDERMAQSLAGQRYVTGTDGAWWVDSLIDNLTFSSWEGAL